MSTHSPPFPKDSNTLNLDSTLPLSPDYDSRASTAGPTNMPPYSHRQNIPHEPGQIAEVSSPEALAFGFKLPDETQGRQGEQGTAPVWRSDNQPVIPSETKPRTHSLPSANVPPKDGDVQRQILDILTQMLAKMDSQEDQDNGLLGATTRVRPHPAMMKTKLMGIPKHLDQQQQQQQQQFNPVNDDYEKIFPEDPYGQETGPNARVFRVYNEESAIYDTDMIGQSNDSSDVLLVFAGLFSAVLTTFVAQTSQALETDPNAISNSLLSEVVHLLRAQENGSSFAEVEPAITETIPSRTDLWVNGLWFTSLTLSLATALFAVLTKQWIRQYMIKTSGTIRDRSLIHQFRFAGIQKWHVITIIGILPLLLHLSLGVILAGLVAFLIPRSLPLAYVVGVITVVVYLLYFISNLIPVFDIQCPYRTPFSGFLNVLPSHFTFAGKAFVKVLNYICAHLHRLLPLIGTAPFKYTYTFRRLGVQELEQVQEQSDSLSLDVIKWLIDTSSNPSVHAVAVEAIGGLPPSQREGTLKRVKFPRQNFTRGLIRSCLIIRGTSMHPACREGCAGKLERLTRAFPPLWERWDNPIPWDIYSTFRHSNDMPRIVSALGLGSNKERNRTITLHRLFNLPNTKLSPCAWINLFKNLHDVQPTCKFEICKRALEYWNPGTQFPNWNGQTSPVPMAYVLTRGSPEVVLSAFPSQDYDPFTMDPSMNPSLPKQDSPVRPLETDSSMTRFRVLLTIHHFLEGHLNTSDSPIENLSLGLFRLVWMHIHNELKSGDPVAPYCAVRIHTTARSLLESPLLKGNRWMATQGMSDCCHAVLGSFDDALSLAPSNLRGIQWTWAERAAEITFPTGDVPSDLDISPTRKVGSRHWAHALDRDTESAYTNFIKSHVLEHDPSAFEHFPWLLPHFILGLVRLIESLSPHPPWLTACKEYLHEPDNLFKAFKILAKQCDKCQDVVLVLVQIDSDNEAWEGCRARLRQWHPDNDSKAADFLDSLDALDEFFESRHRRSEVSRRLDIASFFRNVFGRHTNIPVFPHSTDIEMGFATSPQTEFSGNTNTGVDGELDRESGEEQPQGVDSVDAQPTIIGDEQRSPPGSETAMAQDDSPSSNHAAGESASERLPQHIDEHLVSGRLGEEQPREPSINECMLYDTTNHIVVET